MIKIFENQEALIKAFVTKDGELNGYIPSKMIDSSKLQYPVKIELNEQMKTFALYEEPKVEPITTKAKKAKLSKGALIGIICGSIALVALIIGLLCYFLI